MHLNLIRQQLELILQRDHTFSSVYLIRGLSFLKHIWTDPLYYDTTYTVITASTAATPTLMPANGVSP